MSGVSNSKSFGSVSQQVGLRERCIGALWETPMGPFPENPINSNFEQQINSNIPRNCNPQGGTQVNNPHLSMNPVQGSPLVNVSTNLPLPSNQQFSTHVQANRVVPISAGIQNLGNHSLTMTHNTNQLAPQLPSVSPFQNSCFPMHVMGSGYHCTQNVASNRYSRTSRDQSYQDSLEALRRNLVMTLGSDPSNSQAQRTGNSNRVNHTTLNSHQTPPVINIIMDSTTRNVLTPFHEFMSSVPGSVNPSSPSQGCLNSTSFNPISQAPALSFNPVFGIPDSHLNGPWSIPGNGPWGPSRSPVMHPYYNMLWDPYMNLPWDPYLNRPYMPFWPMPWDPTWKTS